MQEVDYASPDFVKNSILSRLSRARPEVPVRLWQRQQTTSQPRNIGCFRRCDTSEMEVGLFPNPFRPGIGLRPRREAQRPLLPQHARHCPVLEAGSTAGFLVHPPLAEKETFQVGYEGEGRYQLVYSVNAKGSKWEPIFTVTYLLPMGGIGATKREIKMHIQDTPQTREIAHLMPGMFICPG